MKHVLKIWPEYFERVNDGTKTFEVRQNDRAYKTGDQVLLQEWDPARNVYTGRQLEFDIGYVLKLDHGARVVFSLMQQLAIVPEGHMKRLLAKIDSPENKEYIKRIEATIEARHPDRCDVEWNKGEAQWKKTVNMNEEASICIDCYLKINATILGNRNDNGVIRVYPSQGMPLPPKHC